MGVNLWRAIRNHVGLCGLHSENKVFRHWVNINRYAFEKFAQAAFWEQIRGAQIKGGAGMPAMRLSAQWEAGGCSQPPHGLLNLVPCVTFSRSRAWDADSPRGGWGRGRSALQRTKEARRGQEVVGRSGLIAGQTPEHELHHRGRSTQRPGANSVSGSGCPWGCEKGPQPL